MSSIRRGTASTRRMIASTVVRSLNTGMTTDNSGSEGTARSGPAGFMEFENVPYAAAGVKRLLVMAPNWLGDAVMALPAIGDVLRGPGAVRVDVAARPSVAPLFSLVDGVSQVIAM